MPADVFSAVLEILENEYLRHLMFRWPFKSQCINKQLSWHSTDVHILQGMMPPALH